MKIHEWIIENLDLANSFGAKGLIPIDIGENFLNFQQMDYPVEYVMGESGEALIRIDHIYEPLGSEKIHEEFIGKLVKKLGVTHGRP